MKITDLIIDPRSLGNKLWLVEVTPAYEYGKDGRRTDTITGYRYSVALPEKGLDKISVRIDGKPLMEAPNCSFVLFVGTKKLVKRKEFEQFISNKLII